MLSSMELQTSTLQATPENNQKCCIPMQGQKIIFEKEEAEVVRVKPLFVIRTRDRVVCGALHDRFECKEL